MDPRRLLPYLIGLSALTLLTTLGVVVWQARETGSRGSVAVSAGDTDTRPNAEPIEGTGRDSPERAVLAAWDAGRSKAWAEGSVGDLRSLYVEGSAAGRRDAAMLSAYTARGLRVEGMRTQVLGFRVRRSSRARLVATVTDRVVGGQVVGRTRSALPVDRPTTRTVTLRRVGGRWLMVSVRE